MAERTLPSAGLSPIDAYMVEARPGGYFEQVLTATASYPKCIDILTSSSGNPTITHWAPIYMYCKDPGTGCTGFDAIDIGLNFTNIPTIEGRCSFFRLRGHGSGIITSAFELEGDTCTSLFKFAKTNGYPCFDGGVAASSVGFTGQIYKLKVTVGGVNVGYLVVGETITVT